MYNYSILAAASKEAPLLPPRIISRTTIAAAVLAVVSALLLWGWLFGGMPWGVNFTLVIILFYAAALFIHRGKLSLANRHNWVLLVLIAPLAATFTLFSNDFLLFLNMLAIMITSAIQLYLMTEDEMLKQPLPEPKATAMKSQPWQEPPLQYGYSQYPQEQYGYSQYPQEQPIPAEYTQEQYAYAQYPQEQYSPAQDAPAPQADAPVTPAPQDGVGYEGDNANGVSPSGAGSDGPYTKRDPFTLTFLPDVIHWIFVKPFHMIRQVFRNMFMSREGKKKKAALGIVIGLAVAIPLLVILLILLSSADMVFADMLNSVLSFENIWNTVLWGMLFAGLFVVLSSFFVSSQVRRRESVITPKQPVKPSMMAVYIILIAAAVPLLVFAAIQLIFLFGQASLPAGISYSDYARSGFFQLVAAAVVVFVLVAVMMRITKTAEKRHLAYLKLLFTLLMLAVVLMLVSSFCRMVMYEQAHMFTRLRLYVQAFIVMLTVIVAFVLVMIWRGRLRIGKAVFFTVMISLIALSYFNVDGFIGRHNQALLLAPQVETQEQKAKRMNEADHLLFLSPDALPYYIDRLTPDMLEPGYNSISRYRAQRYLALYDEVMRQDVRHFNVGREIARQKMAQRQDLYQRCLDIVGHSR